MLAGSPWLRTRFARIAPHIVDTALLASAAWLCLELGQYPLAQGWLTATVVALVVYIGLGTAALRGRTRAQRAGSFAGALLAAMYIVAVALTHDPRGPLAWIES